MKFGSWTYDGNQVIQFFLSIISSISKADYMSQELHQFEKEPGLRFPLNKLLSRKLM